MVIAQATMENIQIIAATNEGEVCLFISFFGPLHRACIVLAPCSHRDRIVRQCVRSYSLLTQEVSQGEDKLAHANLEVIQIDFCDVQEYVLDLLGPKIHARITRRYQQLPVTVSAEMPVQFYLSVFRRIDLLVDQDKINQVFGVWTKKTFERGSYALLGGPINITQDRVSRVTTKVKIAFYYKVYNSYGVLQW